MQVMLNMRSEQTSAAKLNPISRAVKPFELLGIDFASPLPETDNDNRYVLVLTDYLTRLGFATRDMKASTVARILVVK
jgi:hypothetical protein